MSTSSSNHRLAIGALDLFGGIPTPLKNMKASWDDYSQYMESNKIHVPNHQPVMFSICFNFIEGSLEVKLPTIWTDEKQSREEAERRERLEERRGEEKE